MEMGSGRASKIIIAMKHQIQKTQMNTLTVAGILWAYRLRGLPNNNINIV